MRYEYYYYVEAPQELLVFLTENKIKHKVNDDLFPEKHVKFSIYSSQQNHQELLDTLTKVYGCRKPLVFCVYTAKDRSEAEFLWVTPYKYCIEVRNDEEAFQFSCNYVNPGDPAEHAFHRRQISPFQIVREPKTNSRAAFYTLDTGSDPMFADCRIKEMAEKHDLRGLLFQPVYLKNGVESRHIFQVSSPHVFTMDAAVRGYGEKSEFCPLCGKEQLDIDSSYQMHLNRSHLDPSLDLMVSENFWGPGCAASVQIISQKFYQLLLEEKLTGSLRIAPIVLHD